MPHAHELPPFPAPEHDHGLCLEDAMERAQKAFDVKGLKLTPLRQAVFREIASSHRAIGAYEVLEAIAQKGERLAPISVYRAIDALVEVGLVHRFESRNAFFACHTGHEGRQMVLACDVCGRVAEVASAEVFTGIDGAARLAHFTPRTAVVEVWGLCGACKAAGKTAGGQAANGSLDKAASEPAQRRS
jgi:Fur family zinc uptake transcriptional regulator